jgi:1-deoxy-D-xylulose-5-phosphate synthase
MYTFLDQINSPDDLKKFKPEQLIDVAKDCRQFLIETMSKTSGHFASSLGVVELTVALHYVYNTPNDQIVWDVGHQAYIHKILTGRKDDFKTLRKYNGLSGFPKRDESKYDTFGVGHASTSISAGYGMACAMEHLGKKSQVVSVIGDGALTGGLAFEGLNNAGTAKKNFVVVLNDNDMSIDNNVGGLNKYFNQIMTSRSYNKLKDEVWNWANRNKTFGNAIKTIGHKVEEGIVGTLTPGAIFEQFGFNYIGPVDGHDLPTLVNLFEKVKLMHGPILVHLITKKGKGYEFAEADALKYHAVSAPFNPQIGVEKPKPVEKVPYTKIFADAVERFVEKDKSVVVITPAMISGSGLKSFSKQYPKQLYDVGIAEGHAVTFAAGLATQNMKVIVAIYSTFLQRAYDNVIHDVAIQKLNILFCIDRAGVVGPDGPTHHGCYDISYLRCIPNLTIMIPGHAQDVWDMMYTGLYHHEGPAALRYPRDSVNLETSLTTFNKLEIGKAEQLQDGEDVAILAIGSMVEEIQKALPELERRGVHPAVYNMRFVKPIDEALLTTLAAKFKFIITLEEGSEIGGFGSACVEYLADHNLLGHLHVKRMGIPDRYIPHGTRPELFVDMQLDANSLVERIEAFVHSNVPEFLG